MRDAWHTCATSIFLASDQMQIERPKLGQITQGTIFSAASCESYCHAPTWGLCITARCDVAHEGKTEVFNYIPIVRFEDWLLIDGHKIITKKVAGELKNNLRSALTNAGLSGTVLEVYSPVSVMEKFFPLDSIKFDAKKHKLHETARTLACVLELQSRASLTKTEFKYVCEAAPKIYEKYARDLWANQVAGYYFFPEIGDSEHQSACGYIALMREIHHISREGASAISQGVSLEEFSEKKYLGLNFTTQDFSYPVGKVPSPWIEHFMQQFTMLFSRIGLPDAKESGLLIVLEAYKNG